MLSGKNVDWDPGRGKGEGAISSLVIVFEY